MGPWTAEPNPRLLIPGHRNFGIPITSLSPGRPLGFDACAAVLDAVAEDKRRPLSRRVARPELRLPVKRDPEDVEGVDNCRKPAVGVHPSFG